MPVALGLNSRTPPSARTCRILDDDAAWRWLCAFEDRPRLAFAPVRATARRYRAVGKNLRALVEGAKGGTDVRVFARHFVSAMLVPRPPAFWTGGYLSTFAFFAAFLPIGVRDFLSTAASGTRSLNLRPSSC